MKNDLQQLINLADTELEFGLTNQGLVITVRWQAMEYLFGIREIVEGKRNTDNDN